jgi:hypothetical protein
MNGDSLRPRAVDISVDLQFTQLLYETADCGMVPLPLFLNDALVKILDETRVSLSGKVERLIYIDIPRRNASKSRDEIMSKQSKETKGNCTSAGKVKG